MRTVVQKFGGSSVATVDRIRSIARKVAERHRKGWRVVVVVSAMGDTTDHYMGLATSLSTTPPVRELDMLLSAGERVSMSLLAMAIQEEGVEAVSLTGPQAGLITNDAHANARIVEIRPFRITDELEKGRVVVVAGFQGESYRGEVTTLGRGGSDTTAVALTAALGAEACEICSDVDGVYTADPRIVPAARKLERMDYDEMLELARHGARVLKSEAVEYARKTGISLVARSTFAPNPGTVVQRLINDSAEASVVGVAGRKDLLQLDFQGGPELGARLSSNLAECDILHGQASSLEGRLGFVVSAENLADMDAFKAKLERDFARAVTVSTPLGSVAAVGAGIGSRPDVSLRAYQLLQDRGVAFSNAYATRDSVSCLVPIEAVDDAVGLLHEGLIEKAAAPC